MTQSAVLEAKAHLQSELQVTLPSIMADGFIWLPAVSDQGP